MHSQRLAFDTLDFGYMAVLVDSDTTLFHPRRDCILNYGIESPQDLVIANHQLSFRPKCIEDTSELNSNVSSANNDDAFRLLFQVEKSIRVYSKRRPRNS